jgi:polysaccharide export outer membrane protein
MPNGQLTLSQALASAQVDGVNDNEQQVRIIRSYSPTRGALLVVDFEKIMRGQALPFPLMEGDIVYVPRSGIGNWNMAIKEILPSLQAISNVLQPFVQIKFLSD